MSGETKYARSGDVHIAYQVIGEGPRDLIFVPGFVSNVEDWWEEPTCVRFFKRLTSYSRLILFDKRGTGQSDRVAAMPSIEQRIDDIRAVLDAAGSPRPVIFGVSDGASLGAVFAATHPERTSALVLYGTIAAYISWTHYGDDLERVLASIDETWGTGASLSRYAPSMVDDRRFKQWWARHEREGGSPGAVMALMRMTSEIDIRPVLQAIRVPTLVIHRAHDSVVGVEAGHYLAQQIPDAQYVELPGQDHLPWVANADAILDEVEEFVTGVRPATRVDRMLATVAVADIPGASALAFQLGDRRWQDLLEQFHDSVRRELERHQARQLQLSRGHLIAAFDGPARAVHCLSAIRAHAGRLGIDLRSGMHTGEILLGGDGLVGVTVQIASWVAEMAGQREILVSSTVKDLVAGSGLRFEDRGEYTLAGADQRWRLFAVGSSDVGRASPPVPPPATHLSPREREVAIHVARGLTNRQIAEELTITEGTAALHIKHILAKLGFSSRSQIAAWAATRALGPIANSE